MNAVIRSVNDNQHALLSDLLRLHVPEGLECDVTFGNGSFYKHGIQQPRLRFDIDPQVPDVVRANSCALPLPDASIGSLMFDPPFLTYVKRGRSHKAGGVAMSARFGGYYSYDELEAHYHGTITEAARVLRDRGRMVFKCQDIIHNHRMHCTHARVIASAERSGFRLLDLFVLAAKHRMPSPQKGTQRHARVFHSYFLAFERGRRAPCVL